jgi:hypothetical protein
VPICLPFSTADLPSFVSDRYLVLFDPSCKVCCGLKGVPMFHCHGGFTMPE